jgi:hypothetical protein
VVQFLVGRFLHLLLDFVVSGDRRVTLVEALCGNLPGMIDPHQSG